MSDKNISAEIFSLLKAYSEPAVLLSTNYEILAANSAYLSLYEMESSPINKHCFEISHHYDVPCDQAGELCPLHECRQSGETRRVLHIHHTPHGKEHIEVEMHPIKDAKGNICYFMEVMRQTRTASTKPTVKGLVGQSPIFNQMLELVQRVAPSSVTVLLQGETGTGKELVAQAVHNNSLRQHEAFVTVECSGLSETLFESELFGHEKGAFTGAIKSKTGLVDAAQGGTLFLDEIGDVPLNLQVKLLRLLETGTYRPVGSIEVKRADFRLICATHRGLQDMVAKGEFREDLYYRISAFPIHLPALRERKEDISLLVETLLKRITPQTYTISRDAITCLENYSFPGNVRQLRNILERATLLADGKTLQAKHFSEACSFNPKTTSNLSPNSIISEILPLDKIEKEYLSRIYANFTGDKSELARQLGISERTLYRKLQAIGQ